MNILRVISTVNPAGGGPIEGIKQISPVLLNLGHSTEVVSLDDPDAPFLKELPFPVYALGPAGSGYGYTKSLVPWLRNRASRYDYVLVHGLWQYSSFGAWRALNGSSTPYYVFPHGMLDPWFKRTYPLKHLKKALYWPWAEYRVLRDAQAVCFTCEEERILARQSFRAYKCRELVVNYGTAGPVGDQEALRQEFYAVFPELKAKRIVLFLSRIHVKKGCDLLIEAFAAAANNDPSLRLVMAGPDSTGIRQGLEAQAARLGIDRRITWTGMLAGDLKWGAFHAAEVFVLPSHQENFGIAVAEALACGLPVLISNKVNIWREIVGDGAGIADVDDVEGAIRLLRNWIKMPHEAQQKMRARAKQCFSKRFEIHQAARSLIDTLGMTP